MAKKQSRRSPDQAKRPRKVPVEPMADEATAIIKEIYTDDAGVKDASLKTIERSSGPPPLPKRWLIGIGIFALLGITSVAGFFTFNQARRFNEQGVTLAVGTPGTVASAGEAKLILTVTNGESVSLRNVELTVTAPEGWVFKEGDPRPADQNNSLWSLGSIGAGGQKSVTVFGVLTGEVGSVKTFNAAVTYRPANFNYDFSTKASGSVTIGSSIIELDLDGATQASPGTTATYTLTYTNSSRDSIRDLRLIATYPNGFITKLLDPKPREGNSVWVLNELPSGGTGTITVEGSFVGNAGDSVELGFAAELQRGSSTQRQVEASLVILLVSSTVDVKLKVNGQESAATARPGETLNYELSYKNTSDLDVKNIVVALELTGGALDPKSFSDDYGSTLTDRKVSWDVKRVPDLVSLKPGVSGTIRFTAKVLDPPAETKGAGGPTVEAQALLTLGVDSGTNAVEEIKLPRLMVKIVSAVTPTVEGRYYGDQGETVGSGPLPPTAGQTTAYRISWFVGNSTNELKDMTITASVPSQVTWTGQRGLTTAGTVTFDAATRMVSWTLNRLPKGAAATSRSIAAHFELSITPTPEDVGSIMTLLEQSKLTATDGFAGTKIEAVRDRVTTDLPNDQPAAGKGVVVAGS
ncbi:MAG: hypothetical protein HY567_04105 [Candidatus Kerfeldbacteria bacterium]|nr:hypothetical protein [Candidatus Kerfeldbacteria bacterium]